MSEMFDVSDSLQAFSDASACELKGVNDYLNLAHNRTIRECNADDYSWQDVSSVLIKNVSANKSMKNLFVKDLEAFHRTVNRLVGSELNSATLSAASVYIFLHLSKKKYVSSTVIMKLCTKLAEVSVKDGAFTRHIMRYLGLLTGRILSWFDSDQGIVELLHTVVHLGSNESTGLNSDSGSDGNDREVDTQYIPQKEPFDTGYKNMKWLSQQLSKYSDRAEIGMSIEDLSSTVFVTLKSTKEESELQNDLFELLEYDGFEVIPTLLENRNQLVDYVTKSS